MFAFSERVRSQTITTKFVPEFGQTFKFVVVSVASLETRMPYQVKPVSVEICYFFVLGDYKHQAM